ncbi:hypothetical protein ACFE04_009194 [Oxalis oulophora]
MLLHPYHHHHIQHRQPPLLPPLNPLIHHSLSLLNLPITRPKNKRRLILTTSASSKPLPQSAISRIADKLRSLGYTTTKPNSEHNSEPDSKPVGEIFIPLPEKLPKQRVGHTLDQSWSTPDNPVPEPATGEAIVKYRQLWGRVWREKRLRRREEEEAGKQRVPTLAELTLAPEELRRLQKVGLALETKMKIGKAGITEGIVNGIHERWRRSEVVKIVCEDLCRYNMKRTHDLLERKTGGFVVWRSGTKIMLYRGANYKYPYFDKTSLSETSPDDLSDRDTDSEEYDQPESLLLSTDGLNSSSKNSQPALIQGVGSLNRVRFELPGEAELMEQSDNLLDGLGPRFTDWWGYGPPPVDGDLLPAVIPGYRKPFRLLPFGVQPKLTGDEMNALRRLGRPLPCHFVLAVIVTASISEASFDLMSGRNRRLQGLAAAIIKLWEKCEIAKVAVKRGAQNTNNKMMADELKWLTGGTLLTRNKEYIILYRGKDFLPSVVSSAIEERRKRVLLDKQSENSRASHRTVHEIEFGNTKGDSEAEFGENKENETVPISELEKEWSAETDIELRNTKGDSEAEFGENKDNKTIPISEPKMLWSAEADIETTNLKLSMALEKKAKAEQLLAELEENEEFKLQEEADKEGITEEERYMLRKIGLQMKPFLLMGRRGVFAGTVENMHLHWKYRELVKIICKERTFDTVHSIALTLESESGGILVAVERVSKGFAIIVYRGKNYERPASLRPQTLLTKRQAMKRSLEAQRRQSLKLHVLKLTTSIDELEQILDKNKEGKSEQLIDDLSLLLAEEDHGKDLKCREEITTDESKCMEEMTTDESKCMQEMTTDESRCMEEIKTDEQATKNDKLFDSSSSCDDSESEVNSSESVLENAHVNPSTRMLSGSEAIDTISSHDNSYDELVDSSSSWDDIENQLNSSESVLEKAHNNSKTRILSGSEAIDTVSSHDNFSYDDGVPPVNSAENGSGLIDSMVAKTESNKMASKSVQLSNKERLLLRKRALQMRKRPVLAVGKSNVVTGVAKAIKAHFERHPLAIVNLKGRANGTSMQEVVFQLEQATGAVVVSLEPCHVILYRGWGAQDEPWRKNRKISAQEIGEMSMLRSDSVRPAVCPELMAAIRLECGLQQKKIPETGS